MASFEKEGEWREPATSAILAALRQVSSEINQSSNTTAVVTPPFPKIRNYIFGALLMANLQVKILQEKGPVHKPLVRVAHLGEECQWVLDRKYLDWL